MSFEWNKIHKFEESFESEIIDSVEEYIMDYYDITEIHELTKDQVNEIKTFTEELNEYSVMQVGLNNILMQCEDME
tara:strand:+ start:543 stop:770 length:228 start_codon:yes stop_codon:yes gene_type:complete